MDKIINLKNTDVLAISDGCLYVNGVEFTIDYPTEQLYGVEDNKLVTLFRGHLYNYWEVGNIVGHYT